ncbi:translation factor SUA5 [Fluviicoccus keumensis]|uniref:Threonylcarbamoyl-AMP synthase n=1 Tax=Fluviicoccus keumensis TaxID=1435465 RepID=A0A4Q7YP59_9GAMM|nr:Sua5/YciO/YrdC/YwlC family protein [Fluviicoccus keumensis]RZU38663.1 translation factor SUA5 [Fluviicoccus keumensis]
MSFPSDIQLRQAVRVLDNGGVIAYPTEAVWGLGCDPFNRAAVLRLLEIKQRPMHKGLIIIAAEVGQVLPWLGGLTVGQCRRVIETWPGPNTWVVPVGHDFPEWVRGDHASVAVRVSAHPGVQALCRRYGGALVSTSANRTGLPPARSALQVQCGLRGQVDYRLPGRLGGQNKPTLIRDALTGQVLRPS